MKEDPQGAIGKRTFRSHGRGPSITEYQWQCPICQRDYWTRPYKQRKTCSPECCVKLRAIWYPRKTHKEKSAQQRAANRAFVSDVNARTFCAHCGAQPVEWHNPEHVQMNRQNYRISRLMQAPRSIAVIQAEMDRCTPLCRRCHMKEDGRLQAFIQSGESKRTRVGPIPLSPCIGCGKLRRLIARGRCKRCYAWWYYRQKNAERIGARQARIAENRNRQPKGRARGERIGTSKFTPETVQAIRKRLEAGASRRELAREYGVNVTSIRAIALRLSWTHVA